METFTIPAIHPTLVQPCAKCGQMIDSYSRVVRFRPAGYDMTEDGKHDVLFHPACVTLWLREAVNILMR